MERNRRVNQRALGNAGQGTVEFCIVLCAFIVIALAGAAWWHALDDGLLIQHAAMSASRDIRDGGIGAWADVFVN